MTTSHDTADAHTTSHRSVPQWLALATGAVFTVVGLAGFAVTGFEGWTAHDPDQTLLGFAVNPLHNVVHVVLALVWLAAAPRARTARAANLALGVVLGLVTVLGFVGVTGMLGMSGFADPDNFLHLATATLSLYFGTVAAGAPAQPGVSDRT
jgi:hypothetical protein